MTERIGGHGGDLLVGALQARGVSRIFTLIGGHIFAVLDAAQKRGIPLVDVRHEQAAAFAAEAHGKLAREPGVAVVDAGPGLMNALNPIASAASNGSPMILVAGHPPRGLAGMGSLNETPQFPVLEPVAKRSIAISDAASIAAATLEAHDAASRRHRGPVYLEFPLDAAVSSSQASIAPPDAASGDVEGDVSIIAKLLAEADHPVLFLGSDVWLDGADRDARALAERQRIPVIMNGMARGILPADHELAFSAARGAALRGADLVLVVGVSLDFRLGYGTAFGDAKVVHLQDDASRISRHASLAASASGSLRELLAAAGEAPVRDRSEWLGSLRAIETERRERFAAELRSDGAPIHPARVYGELVPRMPRDAIVIADGGDFASYAGKYIEMYEPGAWLDPGPYGCLGTSAGYALAAGSLYPGRRIVVLLGDGAAGFSLADWDTLVRYGIDVTFVCGNNGIWGLEKQPMRALYGRDVVADLRPETRYDEIMRAFGGHGAFVKDPAEVGPAIERALATPGPSLVNVVTDPGVDYPRGGSGA